MTETNWPPCPDPFNMAAHVLAHAARLGDKTALTVFSDHASEDWSYARLQAAVLGTATGLLAQGLAPGDRVLMRIGNSVDFPIAYLGAIAAGLVPVPTSAQLTAAEVASLLPDLVPGLIIAAPGVPVPETATPQISTADLRAMQALPPAAYHMGDANRPAYIVYTSGTSGKSRGVIHAHRAIWARGMMHQGWYGLTEADRLCHAGAFNWTYTLGTGLMDPWTMGATALIPVEGTGAERLAPLLARHRATIFAAAPGVYRQMLRHEMPPLPDLRHGLSAGEKLPAATRAAWIAATGTAIHEAFGMSECSTFVSGSPARPAPDGSLGFAQPGRRVRILTGDTTDEAAPGTAGTLAVHKSDPGLMLGYLAQPAETAARYRGDWFLTGDMGVRDAQGATTYLGRDDDMMNAGGFRVSPIEVETALNAHPAIHESAAVELPVKADATVIAAFYVADADIPETDLHAFLASRLARYKSPRILIRSAALPKGANGKLLRRQLRDQWKADRK